MPIDFHSDFQIMALGGQQKSAVALSNGYTTVLGPHLGDLDTMRSRERFMKHQAALQSLMNCELPVLACDQHPDFFTSRLASEIGSLEFQSIQHHHAHIVSAMVEHGSSECTTLGFSFDGTGFGNDGTIWGGEVLVANATSFRRVGHLRTFPLVGGDAAVKQPWRIAVSLLVDAMGEQKTLEVVDSKMLSYWQIDQVQLENLLRLGAHASMTLRTSSMGRLLDGVAALVCGFGQVSFEGEAAMRLEATCNSEVLDTYCLCISDETPFELDWRPMVRELVADLASSVPIGTIAMKFHRAIAECIAAVGLRFPNLPIVLAGGVFQNRVLVELVDKQLCNRAIPFAMPCKIPPNDGGLAIGQLVISAARIERALCV